MGCLGSDDADQQELCSPRQSLLAATIRHLSCGSKGDLGCLGSDHADHTNSPPVRTLIKLPGLARNKYEKQYGISGLQALSMSLQAGGRDMHPLAETNETGKTSNDASCVVKTLDAVGKSAPTEVPSKAAAPAATLETLTTNLAKQGRVFKQVRGGGNCQFHAVEDQLRNECDRQVTSQELRAASVQWIGEHSDEFMPFLICLSGMTMEKYLKELATPGVWGDQLTLLAMANSQRVNIQMISAQGSDFNRSYPDDQILGWPTIYIGYYLDQHYVSTTLVPAAQVAKEDAADGTVSSPGQQQVKPPNRKATKAAKRAAVVIQVRFRQVLAKRHGAAVVIQAKFRQVLEKHRSLQREIAKEALARKVAEEVLTAEAEAVVTQAKFRQVLAEHRLLQHEVGKEALARKVAEEDYGRGGSSCHPGQV